MSTCNIGGHLHVGVFYSTQDQNNSANTVKTYKYCNRPYCATGYCVYRRNCVYCVIPFFSSRFRHAVHLAT